VRAEAEEFAAQVRARLTAEPVLDPGGLFEHVYASPTAALAEQRAFLLREIAEHSSDGHSPNGLSSNGQGGAA
jgi:pyruvate dehydrogenase E1 component alpha subunit